MMNIDIQAELIAAVEESIANPEAQEFTVLTSDIQTALAVAPMLAARLHPDRRWGNAVWAQIIPDYGTVTVAVQDFGPRTIVCGSTQGSHHDNA